MGFLKKNRFKILWISFFIIMFLGIFSKSLGVEAECINFSKGKVNVNCLNIRCGPGIQYKKIGKVYKGEYIDVFTKLGDWYVIKTEDNLVGTVSAKYVDSVNYIEEQDVETQEVEETSKIENQEIILEVINSEYSNSLGLTEEEQEFFNLVNANRENNGLPKLEIDDEVQNIARLKAKDLVENNYFSHVSLKYGDIAAMLANFSINYKTVGENIAGNSNLTGAIEAWMNSESHRANLLSTDYNYTGVAVVESELYGKIFVQVFLGK